MLVTYPFQRKGFVTVNLSARVCAFLMFFCLLSEANVADHKLGIGSDKNEASTSHKEQSPSKKSVEISITVPGTKKKKKGW